MANFCELYTDIWEELLDLPPLARPLYIYLFSNPACRPSGLYKIKFKSMNLYTDATREDFEALIPRWIEYDEDTGEIFVRGKLKRYSGRAKGATNLFKSLRTDYDGLESQLLKKSFLLKYPWVMKGQRRPSPDPSKGHSASASASASLFKDKEDEKIVLKGKDKPDVHKFMDWWDGEYKRIFNRKYVFTGNKEAPLVKQMITAIGYQALIECAGRFLQTHDDFLKKAGHTISILKVRINQLAKGEIYDKLTPAQVRNLKRMADYKEEKRRERESV